MSSFHLQSQLVEHGEHVAREKPHLSLERSLHVDPPPAVIRKCDVTQLTLQRQHCPEVPLSATEHGELPLVLCPLPDPLLEPLENGRKSIGLVDSVLRDSGQLGAKVRQFGIVDGSDVLVELGDGLERLGVEFDAGKLDDFRRSEFRIVFVTSRFEIQHENAVEVLLRNVRTHLLLFA